MFGFEGSGFGVLEFEIWRSGLRVQRLQLGVWDLGFRGCSLGLRVQGLGFNLRVVRAFLCLNSSQCLVQGIPCILMV